MKLLAILRFEVLYRLQRPITWLFLAVYVALAYMVTTSMLVDEATRAGDLHVNAPVGIATGCVIISMMSVLVTAALVSGAALRDFETRIFPLFATSPITKRDYLAGRFLGSFLVNAFLVTVVPICLIAFMRPPTIDATLLGSFRLAAYAIPFVLFLLPNLFVTGAILFAVAILTRRSLPVFVSAAFLFIGSMLIEEMVGDAMELGAFASIIEPFGFTVLSELSEFWTSHDMNSRLVAVQGPLLWNRLLWVGIGSVALVVAHWRFRFDVARTSKRRREAEKLEPALATLPLRAIEVTAPSSSRSSFQQSFAITIYSLRTLVLSRDFVIISGALVAMVLALGSTGGDGFGVPTWPVTAFIAPFLGSFLPATVMTLLTVFYAGELIWRERDAGQAEISDTTSVRDGTMMVGKFVALALLLALLQSLLVLSGVALQILAGHFDFQPALYLEIAFGLQLSGYLLFAALALFVHVVVNSKYAGHVILVLCYIATLYAQRAGVFHNLLVYGSDSGWVYSDISGFGPFLKPLLWLRLYWAGWAMLLCVLALLFSIRGRERGVRRRIELARLRFSRGATAVTMSALLVIIGAGGWIFYNTNVLSEFRTEHDLRSMSAEYERRYGKFGEVPQPTVTKTSLHVEIYPDRGAAEVRGSHGLVNATSGPIRTIHLFLNPEVRTEKVSFDREHQSRIIDDRLGHRSYELTTPLEPGGKLEMTFEVRFERNGFANSDPNTSVVSNGTYFDHTGGRSVNHRRWLPLVGYQPNRELSASRTRREHGLAPKQTTVADNDEEPSGGEDAGSTEAGSASAGREAIMFDATIGTSGDQIGIAPGSLRKTWTANGRRYFHYATDRPVKNAFAILSARYALHAETYNGVRIELFHHPSHTFNVQRFGRSARASLDYYQANFGPYPHKELRIVEFPRYGWFAHAYPGTISHGEGFGWLSRVEEEVHFDLPTAVVAHEVAHQWWGFQVVPAPVEGAAMLTEVLSQYGALMVTEKVHGKEMVDRFLSNSRIEYLNRRGRREPEAPLLGVTDQRYLVYSKAPVAMYALRHYIGEGAINSALRRVVQQYGSGRAPYATSRDLYRELRATTAPEYHYLLEDMLATITLWDLRTTAATAVPEGGRWKVTLDVEAGKVRADAAGKETDAPMNDFVEIGVYAAVESGSGSGKTLHLEKHKIRSGKQSITVVVDEKPALAGIDPDLHLIDRQWTDNTRPVNVQGVR